jgi:F-type H+-transporting ATPase subunit delta
MPGNQLTGPSRDSLAAVTRRLDELAGRLADRSALETLADQLWAAVDLLDHEHTLRRALSDPSLDDEARRGLAEQLFGRRLDPPARQVLGRAVTERWSRPGDLTDALDQAGSIALFVAAEQAGNLDDVEDQLFRFARIVDGEPQLWTALSDQGLPVQRRIEVVHALLDGKVDPVTLRLVDRAVGHPRGRIVDEAVGRLAELAAARQARYIAEVRTAVPLTAQQRDRLADGLRRLYDHDVRLQVEIDPGLIGGLVVRVGDEVIDGTITHRLALARRRFGG